MDITLWLLWGGWLALGLLLWFVNFRKALQQEPSRQVLFQPLSEKSEDEEVEDDNDDEEDVMANVVFFQQGIEENKDFYRQLSKPLQQEFDRLFILEHEHHLIKELVYVIDGQNASFFEKVFNFIYRYRKIISLGLLKEIYEELVRLAKQNEQSLTLIHEAMIRTCYFRRKDEAFLHQAKEVAEKDVLLHQEALNTKGKYVHSFVRLAIILEKQKQYQEALKLVDQALLRLLDDRTKGGYTQRKERLLKKIEKENQ